MRRDVVTASVRFGAATLPPLLARAAATDFGLVFTSSTRGERRLSFTELAAGAATGASVLRAHGVRAGDRVCLFGSTSAELVVAMWAVWWAGGVVVVLPPPRRLADAAAHADELARRVQQADARLLLVAEEQAPVELAAPGSTGPSSAETGSTETGSTETGSTETGSTETGSTVKVLPLSRLQSAVGSAPMAASVESDLALLQFTSGTTARSRAVALTHGQILANISAFSDAVGLSGEDRGVSWLPLYHDMGILLMITAVAHPGELMLMPTEDIVLRPGSWMDALSRFEATVTAGPNQAYGLAARDLRMRPRDLDLSRVRVAGNGAEPVDAAILAEFAEQAGRYGFKGSALCPMYGLAEATLGVTVDAPGDPWQEVWVSRERLEQERVAVPMSPGEPGARRLVACGRPLSGVEVDIRDAGGAVLDDGRVGEIWVRGPSVMAGYWRDDEASRAVLRDGWLRTGDLGFRHAEQLVVCGRAKDMIVVGGRNLYPEDYEQLVATQAGVRRGNVIAFGLVDVERMVVVAETALASDRARQLAIDIMQMLITELSHAPKEVVMVRPGTLPKTSSGKVQRGRCRERYLAGELPVVASARRQ